MVRATRNTRRSAASKRTATKTESIIVNAAAFEKFLKGTHFPTNKEELTEHLKRNQATSEVLDIAEQFSVKETTLAWQMLQKSLAA